MLFGVRDSSIANALRGNEIAEFEARTLRAFFSPQPAGDPLHAPSFLDNENSCLAARVRHVLAADTGEEDVTGLQHCDLLFAGFAVMHVDRAVEHHEHLLAIVHMPAIRLVGPMQARGNAAHVGNVERAPGMLSSKRLGADDVHGGSLARSAHVLTLAGLAVFSASGFNGIHKGWLW